MTDDITRRRQSTGSRECDHTRGMSLRRSTAIAVCRCCLDYLCSICGVTIAWHEGLYVTNPPVQWRYCAKDACVKAEAAYHALPLDEMIRQRGALRAKRVLVHFQDRGIEPRPKFDPPERRVLPSGAVHITLTPRPFVLDVGEACWCNLGKDCIGNHEIYLGDPVHRCGFCGKTFEIKPDDPHWSTGRGPLCPTRGRLRTQLTQRHHQGAEGPAPASKKEAAMFDHADHCDDYIDDPAAPAALRKFLAFARSPAHGLLLPKPHPVLFADHEGRRVRVTVASRLGDVGITTDLDAECGYEQRVLVSALANFSESP